MMTFNIHPNIVTPLGVIVDESPDSEYGVGIVMELATEKTLFDLLWNKDKDISLIKRIEIILDISKGLLAMHEKNFIHGDLKSMNILLFEDLNAKISDFGTSKSTTNTSLNTGATGAGTLNWNAPELLAMDDEGDFINCADARSDIWALGLMIFEVSSRSLPYEGRSLLQMITCLTTLKKLPDMTKIEEMIPQELHDLILLCCDFDPTSRITISEVVIHVEGILVKETEKSIVPIIPRSMNQYNSISKLKETIIAAVLAAQAVQIDALGVQLKLEMNKGFDRVHSALDKLSSQNNKVLTTLLAISNDQLEYPPIFLILPIPSAGTMTSNFFNTFSTSDTFMVLFICQKTLSFIPYGDGVGLKFKLLKPTFGKIAVSVGKFMNDYGPIFKLAALTISTVVTIASGLRLNDLLPSSLFNFDFSSLEFMNSYCDQMAQLGSKTSTDWDNIKQAEMGKGLNEMTESTLSSLAPISKESYFKLFEFLKSHKYDKHKLQGEVTPGNDGRMHWNKLQEEEEVGDKIYALSDVTEEEVGAAEEEEDRKEGVGTLKGSSSSSVVIDSNIVLWGGEIEKRGHLLSKTKYMEFYSNRILFFKLNQKSKHTSVMVINATATLSCDNNTIVISGGQRKGRHISSETGEVKFKVVDTSERNLLINCFQDTIERYQVQSKEPMVIARTSQLNGLMKQHGKTIHNILTLMNEIKDEVGILHEYSFVEMKFKQTLQQLEEHITELKDQRNEFEQQLIDTAAYLLSSNRVADTYAQMSQLLQDAETASPPFKHAKFDEVRLVKKRVELVKKMIDQHRLAIQRYRSGLNIEAFKGAIASVTQTVTQLKSEHEDENDLKTLVEEAKSIIE